MEVTAKLRQVQYFWLSCWVSRSQLSLIIQLKFTLYSLQNLFTSVENTRLVKISRTSCWLVAWATRQCSIFWLSTSMRTTVICSVIAWLCCPIGPHLTPRWNLCTRITRLPFYTCRETLLIIRIWSGVWLRKLAQLSYCLISLLMMLRRLILIPFCKPWSLRTTWSLIKRNLRSTVELSNLQIPQMMLIRTTKFQFACNYWSKSQLLTMDLVIRIKMRLRMTRLSVLSN